MHKFFAAIGEFSVRFRWAVIGVWIAGVVAAVAFGPALSTDSDNSNFLPDSAPSKHAIQLATDSGLQKKNSLSVPVLVARDGGITAADAKAVAALQAKLLKVNHVTQVDVTQTSPQLAQGGHAAELLTVQVSGIQQGPNSEQDFKALVGDIRTQIAATPHDSGFEIHVIGAIADQVDNAAKSGNNQAAILGFSVLAILIILFLIYRSVLAPFITLIPAALVVVVSMPLVALAAEGGLRVSALASVLLDVLVIGAGTDYGLFLVFRVREEIENGRTPKEAVAHAVSRVGESIAFSAGTVIAALLSLLAATFGMYKDLGIPLAIGIGVMLLASLTLTPALLAVLGRAVFWPRRPKMGAGAKVGLWGRISGTVVQKPVPVLMAGVLLFGALAAFTFGFKPSGFGDGAAGPIGSDSATGEVLQAKYFVGQRGDQTQVIFKFAKPIWEDAQAAQVLKTAGDALNRQSVFVKGSAHGPLDVTGTSLTADQYVAFHAKDTTIKQVANQVGATSFAPIVLSQGASSADGAAYRASKRLISPDGRTAMYVVSLAAGDASSSAALHATPDIRSAVTDVARQVGAVDSGVLGQATITYDISSISSSDLKKVIPIAIIVIGLLLVVVMRSVVAPIYLIVSVALSYLAALGTAVLVFILIGGEAGLVFFLPFMMFIFLLALGEDYNILVMTRIREEAHHKPLKEAVRDALNATGTTVTSAGLVLAATFGVFAVVGGSGGGSQIRDLGVGMVVGILMDTFLVRTLLVPSTVILLGKWNWWPSKFSHDHRAEVVLPSGVELAD